MIWLRCGNLFELLGQEWVASILFILLGGLITWILANLPEGTRARENDNKTQSGESETAKSG